MVSSPKKLTQDEIGGLFLIAAIIFGAWFRFFPVAQNNFPINDGGLFFVMTKTIQDQAYKLPDCVRYNGVDIPFVYPPFAFYVTGLIQVISKMPLLDLFRWLPAFFSTLAIPAVYLLANSLLESKIQAGVATFLYALLPRTISWLVMGGGITRSLGQLFLILAIYHIYNLFKCSAKKYLFGATIFSALVCLTHPEAALHTVGIAFLLFILNIKKLQTWINAVLVGLGTVVITSAWWLPTLLHYGFDPIFSASQTGFYNLITLLNFFLLPFSEEPLITIIIVLAMIGLAVQIAQKEYLIPLFYIVPIFVEPRSAATVCAIPMSLLASAALCKVIFPGLAQLNGVALQNHKILSTQPEKFLLLYLGIIMLLGMQYYGIQLSKQRVSPGNLQAFEWIADHIPPNKQFIIITGNTDLFLNPIQEWFPVLSGGVSQTTIQGQEWTLKGNFSRKTAELQAIQVCGSENDPLSCIEKKIGGSLSYDYIYITTEEAMVRKITTPINTSTLISSISQDKNYSLVYKNEDVTIFSYKK